MTPRSVTGLLVVGVLALAACGDDGSGQPAADETLPTLPAPTTVVPPATPAPGPTIDLPVEPTREYEVPTGADEVVISYEEVGGFTMARFAFQQPPRLLIGGVGQTFEPGATIAIFPGPLLPAVQTRTITDLGIQRVVAAADAAGLLADVEYESDSTIADASTAVLTINVDGETWVHEAYALGLSGGLGTDGETSAQRQALLDFTVLLGDLSSLAGDGEVGDAEILEADTFEVVAVDVTGNELDGGDVPATVEPWPADADVRLIDLAECTVVADPAVAEVLAAADELTFFSEDGRTYEVFARPLLPGSTC